MFSTLEKAIEGRCLATMEKEKQEWQDRYSQLEEYQKDEFWNLLENLEETIFAVEQEKLQAKMISEGEITLPNGQTIVAGQGGSYTIGSDTYPVTIIGWNKSGKMLYYRAAKHYATSNNPPYQTDQETNCLFVDDAEAEIKIATWRKPRLTYKGRHWSTWTSAEPTGCYRPKGSNCGRLGTKRYIYNLDPTF